MIVLRDCPPKIEPPDVPAPVGTDEPNNPVVAGVAAPNNPVPPDDGAAELVPNDAETFVVFPADALPVNNPPVGVELIAVVEPNNAPVG